MKCEKCNAKIPKERLEILPNTRLCVRCAAANPPPPQFDPDEVCAKASPSGQNGWSPKD